MDDKSQEQVDRVDEEKHDEARQDRANGHEVTSHWMNCDIGHARRNGVGVWRLEECGVCPLAACNGVPLLLGPVDRGPRGLVRYLLTLAT